MGEYDVLVLFVYVRAGSLLVACSHYGAYVMGTDIDYNLVVGIGNGDIYIWVNILKR